MGFVSFDRNAQMTAQRAFATANITTNTTTNGTAVDMGAPGSANQAKTVVFAVHTGTITDGSYAIRVFEDDVVGFGTETEITDTAFRLFGNLTIAATDDDIVRLVSAKVNKRYCRIKITSTGVTTGGTNFNAIAILERF